MRIAVLSDIQGFLAPLDAALDDISSQSIDAVVCLGDIVGFGPDSCACIDRLRSLDSAICIAGDWEQYVTQRHPARHQSAQAQAAVEVIRSKLLFPPAGETGADRLEFLAALPTSFALSGVQFVHGSNRRIDEYIFPEDAYNGPKLKDLFSSVERVCIHGHAPIPSVIYEDGTHFEVTAVPFRDRLRQDTKALVCVGSIRWRSLLGNQRGYTILDDGDLEFR